MIAKPNSSEMKENVRMLGHPRRRAGSENDDAEIKLVTGRW